MSGIQVSRRGDRLIAVKAADPGNDARIRREAEILSALDHPGVVTVIGQVDGDRTELHTAYVGTDTWARTPPSSPEALREGFAALADTMADLHAQGIAHGAISADHVLVGRDHRPVLCGFADAATLDPALERRDLDLLADLLGGLAAGLPEAHRPRFVAISRRTASGELSARALADAVRETAPPPSTRLRLHRRRALLAIAVLGGAALIVGFFLLPDSTDPRRGAPSPTTAAAARPTSTTGVVPSPPSPTTPTTLPAAARTDTATEALEIVHEGRRYALGAEGDIVVLGDWNCDGSPTPALLQVAIGQVSIFATWPDIDGEISATSAVTDPGATNLETVAAGDCDQLRILVPDGSRLFIPEF